MKRVKLVVFTTSTYQYICNEEVAQKAITDFKSDSRTIEIFGVISHCDANEVSTVFQSEKIEGIEMVEIKGF
jgi:Icc-related predicted phosphoesterase